ncbi:MAG: hypothetical protein ACLFQX_04105 [Candidatus Kapaibacterium sp.]
MPAYSGVRRIRVVDFSIDKYRKIFRERSITAVFRFMYTLN